jgi:hypothetical protein
MTNTSIPDLLPQIDYTARDFESVKAGLVEFLKLRFPDDFTDFNESQLGIAMLEVVAFVFDILSLNMDHQVNEMFISTARERKSMIKLTELLNYKMATSTSSSVDLFVDTTSIDSFSGSIVIANRAQAQAGGVIFEVVEEITIQRFGATAPFTWTVNGVNRGATPFFSVTQGESLTETFTGDGSKFQEYVFSREPLIAGSISTTVGGFDWVLVESLQLGDTSDPTNQDIYEVLLDENDRARLKFGDGVTGNIPAASGSIISTYRVGGGDVGNVAANTITQGLNAIHGGSDPVVVGISSHINASGGSNRETVEHARVFAPAFAKTSDRAITFQDFFNLSNGFTDSLTGTVGKAGVIADSSDGISNHVTIYTWAVDVSGKLVPASTALNTALKTFLDSRRSVALQIDVVAGTDIAVDVAALVRVSDEFDRGTVQDAVVAAVQDLFEESRVRFGNELKVSWIYDTIQDVAGVKGVHVTLPNPNIIIGSVEEIDTGTLPSQVGAGPNQVILAAGASAVDDFYCNYNITVAMTIPETRRIIDYDGSTKFATVDSNWDVQPPASLTYTITHPRRVKLDASAVGPDYTNQVLVVNSGSQDQVRGIISWNNSTRVAVVDEDWIPGVTPDPTFTYTVTPDYKVLSTKRITLTGLPAITTIKTT